MEKLNNVNSQDIGKLGGWGGKTKNKILLILFNLRPIIWVLCELCVLCLPCLPRKEE